MSDLDDVRATLLAELRSSPRAPSWQAQALALGALTLAAVGVSLAIALIAGLADVRVQPSAALLGAALLVGTVGGVRPGPRRTRVAALLLLALAAVAHLASLVARGAAETLFAEPGCALAEVAVALLPAVAAVAVLRHFAYEPLRTWLAGAAAAGAGLLVLDLTCPESGWSHTLAFHLAPAGLVAASVAIARARVRSLFHAP